MHIQAKDSHRRYKSQVVGATLWKESGVDRGKRETFGQGKKEGKKGWSRRMHVQTETRSQLAEKDVSREG